MHGDVFLNGGVEFGDTGEYTFWNQFLAGKRICGEQQKNKEYSHAFTATAGSSALRLCSFFRNLAKGRSTNRYIA